MRRRLAWARRVVDWAFRAFPHPFRERHRDDALTYFDDRARDRLAGGGTAGLAALVAATVADTLRAAWAVRREARGDGWVARLRSDVGQGLRAVARRPRFVAAAAVPLALGVAGVASVAAVVDALLIRPLPWPEAERLVVVGRPLDNGVLSGISVANLVDAREVGVPGLEALAGIVGGGVLATTGSETVRLSVARPSRELMDLVGLSPVLGRGFADDEFEDPDVALVSWSLWQARWGGDPAVLGADLETDLGTFRIVGVLPRSWSAPEILRGADGDLWIPLDHGDPRHQVTRAFGFASGVARTAPGVTLDDVNARLAGVARALHDAYPEANAERDGSPRRLEARPLRAETVGAFRTRLWLLLGAVGTLLALACANVANLFLARGTDRTRELALRSVLGAGRARLVRQLLVEAVAVAVVGGVAGTALAAGGLEALVAWIPDLPLADRVTVDLRTAGWAALVSLAAAAGFGLLPAWSATRREPGDALRGGRQPHAGTNRVRGALVVSQTALATALVLGGGLLVNNAVRLALVEPGYDVEGVLTFRPMPSPRSESSAVPGFVALRDALEALPGVQRASGTMFLPGEGLPVIVRVDDPAGGEPLQRWRHTVLPGYFEALGIDLVEGRGFGPSDGADGPPAVVVGESLARELWPDGSAVGRTLRTNDGQARRERLVIGVAADVRNRGPHQPPEAVFYESFLQNPWVEALAMVVRVDGPPPGRDVLARLVREHAPGMALTDVRPLADRVAGTVAEERHYALLLALFSTVALVIAGVGVYATTAYAVARRMREMGIRRAVGAGRMRVAGLVLARSTALVATGTVVGLALGWIGTRALTSLLHGVTPTDPATWAAVSVLLLATALAAGAGPALRATRADPVAILRRE